MSNAKTFFFTPEDNALPPPGSAVVITSPYGIPHAARYTGEKTVRFLFSCPWLPGSVSCFYCKEEATQAIQQSVKNIPFSVVCGPPFCKDASYVDYAAGIELVLNGVANRLGISPTVKALPVDIQEGGKRAAKLGQWLYIASPACWSSHRLLTHLFLLLIRLSLAVTNYNKTHPLGKIHCLEDITPETLLRAQDYTHIEGDVKTLFGLLRHPTRKVLFTPEYGKVLQNSRSRGLTDWLLASRGTSAIPDAKQLGAYSRGEEAFDDDDF